MAVSKSLRFKIFARDAFTCQYCGVQPPDVTLEVDHIHPVSKGGTDDPMNLITSCYDCNRGKSAKVLSETAPKPDADLAFLKIQQETAELRKYAQAKVERDEELVNVVYLLQLHWVKMLTKEIHPTEKILIPWITKYSAGAVEDAISIASAPYVGNKFGWDDDRAFKKLLPYIGAVLRNRASGDPQWQ